MPTKTEVKSNTITLRGSSQIVAEFFEYSINTILYQRGIYEPELFHTVTKYKLKLMITKDKGLVDYLKNVLAQLTEWLEKGMVQKLVLIIASVDTEETLERWVFDVQKDEKTEKEGKTGKKSEKKIMQEIQAVVRQITSSVTMLPLLEEPCSFDLLIYTPLNLSTPEKWEESDPKYISKENHVRLRSFTTSIHKVETSVAYKATDEDD
ncbi:hypothetical protein AAMO2058_001741300 [Amorphochlora amoebiformis]